MVDAALATARDTRKAKDHEARAARIRDAAKSLLGETGITGLTMRAVAGRAGYTAGSVYSYFASKEALLASLAVDEMDQVARDVKQMPDDLSARADLCAHSLRRVVPLLMAARRGDVPAETERALTGRIIAVLRLLDSAIGASGGHSDDERIRAHETIALWSGLVGFALLSGSGRFTSLDVGESDVLDALVARFSGSQT